MSSLGPNDVLATAEDVRYRRVASEGVVVLQDAGEVLALNGVGTRMLELVDGQRSVVEIVAILGDEYSVERDVLEEDVLGFCTQLLECGVVRCTTAESGESTP